MHCINELVEYNCSILVDYDTDVTLVWRIYNSTGFMLGQVSHTLGDNNHPSDLEIAPGFNLSLLNLNGSKSSISFTAEVNRDSYTIECGCMYWHKLEYKQERHVQNKMCNINIEGKLNSHTCTQEGQYELIDRLQC